MNSLSAFFLWGKEFFISHTLEHKNIIYDSLMFYVYVYTHMDADPANTHIIKEVKYF